MFALCGAWCGVCISELQLRIGLCGSCNQPFKHNNWYPCDERLFRLQSVAWWLRWNCLFDFYVSSIWWVHVMWVPIRVIPAEKFKQNLTPIYWRSDVNACKHQHLIADSFKSIDICLLYALPNQHIQLENAFSSKSWWCSLNFFRSFF